MKLRNSICNDLLAGNPSSEVKGGCAQAHFQPQREAILQLPQLWRLRSRLQLAAALLGPKQAPAMAHLSTPVASGQPRPFTPPTDHTAVPLHRTYLASEGTPDDTLSIFCRSVSQSSACIFIADGIPSVSYAFGLTCSRLGWLHCDELA